MTRELDDLILDLRTNEPELGTWVFRTAGDPQRMLAYDERLLADPATGWPTRSCTTSSGRSSGSTSPAAAWSRWSSRARASPGALLELALAADRSFQLAGVFEEVDPDATPATIALGPMNFGPLPMGNGLTRLRTRFWGDADGLKEAEEAAGRPLEAAEAAGARPGHLRPGRHRLGGRGPHLPGGAGQLQPGRADRPGGQLPVRRAGDAGDEDLRPADRLAELDLHPTQRVRSGRRAAPVRHRAARRLRPEAGLT